MGKVLLLCAVFYGFTIFGTMVDGTLKHFGIKLEMATALFFELLAAWVFTLWISTKMISFPWHALYRLGKFPGNYTVPLILAGFGLSIVLSEAASLIPMPDVAKELFLSLFAGNRVFVFLGVCVLAPVAEELFFRGFVFRSFLHRYSAGKAMFVSSLLFAVFHLNPWQAVVAFVIGLLNAWLLARTDSLIPGMVVHFAVNFTGSFLLTALGRLFGLTEQELIDLRHMPWQMLLIGGVSAGAGLLWLFRLRPTANDPASRCNS